ncbi:hypothetical protein EYF80_054494 [Liparis tanakae]|uniref:Uncharacterized protein n=1 Tax=Liparis tanakae TaxID=230148 RepID=A0A4Z2F2I0_9TELE|nr:hypothetical protein EYF80_054494 [Liparis tanakae]
MKDAVRTQPAGSQLRPMALRHPGNAPVDEDEPVALRCTPEAARPAPQLLLELFCTSHTEHHPHGDGSL